MPKKPKTFIIKNIDIDSIHKKYGVEETENITMITDLKKSKQFVTESITFLDQSKNTHLCKV